jgi:hypothetical protein
MKKILIAVVCLYSLNACSIFKKSEKAEKKGCPTDGRNVGAEKILQADDKEVMKAAKKAKYRGRN